MPASPELKLEIKRLVIDTLKLNDVKPEDIDEEATLFGSGGSLKIRGWPRKAKPHSSSIRWTRLKSSSPCNGPITCT